MPSFETMDISPAIAEEMLLHNDGNRNLRREYVKVLARDMQNGKFMPNGDTIRFDFNGRLLDGQHRLKAVVESGVTLKNQIIVRGLMPEAFRTIDSGVRRTDGDRFKILGIKNSRCVCAASRVRLSYDNGDLSLFRQWSSIEKQNEAEKNNDILQESFSIATPAYNAMGGSQGAATAIASFGLEYDKEGTIRFFREVASGSNLAEGAPALAFRNAMLRGVGRGNRMHQKFYLQLLIRAVNKYFKGEKCVFLRWGEKEAYMDLFFRPVLTAKKKPAKQEKPVSLLADKITAAAV